MLILLLRMFVTLTQDQHEAAHHACEVALYGALAPDTADDQESPWVEHVAELACRNDPDDGWFGITRFYRGL